MRSLSLLCSFAIALVLAGCGGSSGSGPVSSGSGGGGTPQQTHIGGMAVSYTSEKPLQPVTSSSQQPAVITGMGGGNFTNISFEPIQNLKNTSLIYNTTGNVGSYSLLTNTKTLLTSLPLGPSEDCSPSFSHDGRIVFFGVNGKETLMTMRADGSGLQSISTVGDLVKPAFSPANSLIAYTEAGLLRIAQTTGTLSATGTTAFGGVQEFAVNATGGTYKLKFGGGETAAIAYNASSAQVAQALNALPAVSGAGASVTVNFYTSGQIEEYVISFGGAFTHQNVSSITADATGLTGSITTYLSKMTVGERPAWSSDGSQIAVAASVADQFSVADVSGIAVYKPSGALAQFYNLGFASMGGLAWSPDNSKWALVATYGTVWDLYGYDLPSGYLWGIHDSSGDGFTDSSPTFSPDGKTIAFIRATSPPSVWTIGTTGQDATQLFSTNTSLLSHLDWQPYPAKKTFIGSGGTLGTAASGFLFGQGPTGFGSLVTFTATTPSSVTVSPQGSAGSDFLVKADSLTNLNFANVYYGATVNVIPGQSSSSSQVLVMFNMADGTVSGVATIAPKAPPVTVKKQGNTTVYTGKFLKVWDATGKVLSPSGAQSIEKDATNHTLRAR